VDPGYREDPQVQENRDNKVDPGREIYRLGERQRITGIGHKEGEKYITDEIDKIIIRMKTVLHDISPYIGNSWYLLSQAQEKNKVEHEGFPFLIMCLASRYEIAVDKEPGRVYLKHKV
jgi:hypothetical protein